MALTVSWGFLHSENYIVCLVWLPLNTVFVKYSSLSGVTEDAIRRYKERHRLFTWPVALTILTSLTKTQKEFIESVYQKVFYVQSMLVVLRNEFIVKWVKNKNFRANKAQLCPSRSAIWNKWEKKILSSYGVGNLALSQNKQNKIFVSFLAKQEVDPGHGTKIM